MVGYPPRRSCAVAFLCIVLAMVIGLFWLAIYFSAAPGF